MNDSAMNPQTINRRSFVRSAAVLGISAAASPLRASSPPANATHPRVARAIAAALAMQRRDWEQGILAQAMLEADQRDTVILLTKAAIIQREPDGRLAVVVSGSPTDPAMGGEAYARAAEWTADPAMQQAVEGLLEWIRIKAPRSADGTLYHVFNAPEMWSDGFNCAPPFLAAMGHYDEALAQIDGYRTRLWNPQKKLLAHIWDDGTHSFRDPAFWGGGNGWAAAGLARTLRHLPRQRRKDRERLALFVEEILTGCLAYQRSDGLFHNVIDQPNTFVETNLAQMLAFAAYEGTREGWLPNSWLAHANAMRDAARTKLDSFGIVQGTCGAPNFDRPGNSTEAQSFNIMMEAASAKSVP
jgi:unsaturated rhamnogalacturonyl hydrolase